MINVIIPMVGEGSRFQKIGFEIPKHMIEVKSKSLFEWAMESLENFYDQPFYFITRTSHQSIDFIHDRCERLGIHHRTIRELPFLTSGQAQSALFVKDLISNLDNPILIYNIDTYVEPDELSPQSIHGDGWIPCFQAEGTQWSFVKLGTENKVVAIEEKKRISEFATIGLYYFRSFHLFKACYESYDYHGKEHYIAPLYQMLINNPSAEIYTKVIDQCFVHVLGTPEDVIQFWPEFASRYPKEVKLLRCSE